MKRILLAAAAMAFLGTSAQAATLVNGSFENGTVNPNFAGGPGFATISAVNSTAITGWTVAAGSVDYIGNYWQAGEGSRSIDLAGGSLGLLTQQIFDTLAGQEYRVTFLVSKNPDNGAPTRTGTFSAGNESFGFSYIAPNTRANMMWETESYVFMAEGATLLSFAADSSAGCCFGPALDNVRIAAVPEPTTWAMMIGGFGLIGGMMRHRRSATRRIAATA